jgi:hypothetical protein
VQHHTIDFQFRRQMRRHAAPTREAAAASISLGEHSRCCFSPCTRVFAAALAAFTLHSCVAASYSHWGSLFLCLCSAVWTD